ncbi:MAG: hypothetical protein LBR26_06740, partial [Prevotella sp.]|nr:hypothetical protein [Prevotella sp.]
LCLKEKNMIHLNIREEDREIIAKGRYTQPHPRVMQKYDALHMKDSGLSNREYTSGRRYCST